MSKSAKVMSYEDNHKGLVDFSALYIFNGKKKVYLKDLKYKNGKSLKTFEDFKKNFDKLFYNGKSVKDTFGILDEQKGVAYFTPAPEFFVEKELNPEIPAEEGVEKTDDEKKEKIIRHTIYKKDQDNGEFIAVEFEEDDFSSNVSLESIYTSSAEGSGPVIEDGDDADTKKKKLSKLLGKTIFVKDDKGEFRETKPVASINRYSKHSMPVVIDENKNVYNEETYRRLNDGRFIKETDLKPIAYRFSIDNKHADAYLIKLVGGGYCIVDKSIHIRRGQSFMWNGIRYVAESAPYPLERTTSNKASVLQTSCKRGDNYHLCTVLKKVSLTDDGTLDVSNTNEVENVLTIERDAIETVQNSIKAGEYDVSALGKAEIKTGNTISLVPIDLRHRYQMSDHVDTKDLVDAKDRYVHKGLKMEVNNKGEVTYPKGGSSYSIRKGLKRDFSIWGTAMVGSLGLYSTAGLALVIAAPLVLGASLGALAVAPPFILAGEAVAKWVSSIRHNRPYKENKKIINHEKKLLKHEKTRAQNKVEVEYIKDGLSDVYDRTIAVSQIDEWRKELEDLGKKIENTSSKRKKAKLQNKYNALKNDIDSLNTNKAKLSFACSDIESQIAMLSNAHVIGGRFVVEDGKADVTAENAYQCARYQNMLAENIGKRDALNKLIKDVQKQQKKGKGLKPKTQAKLDEMLAKYYPNDEWADTSKLDALIQQRDKLNTFLEAKVAHYDSGDYNMPASPEFEALLDNTKTMHAFLQAKLDGDKFIESIVGDEFEFINRALIEKELSPIVGISDILQANDNSDKMLSLNRIGISEETVRGLGEIIHTSIHNGNEAIANLERASNLESSDIEEYIGMVDNNAADNYVAEKSNALFREHLENSNIRALIAESTRTNFDLETLDVEKVVEGGVAEQFITDSPVDQEIYTILSMAVQYRQEAIDRQETLEKVDVDTLRGLKDAIENNTAEEFIYQTSLHDKEIIAEAKEKFGIDLTTYSISDINDPEVQKEIKDDQKEEILDTITESLDELKHIKQVWKDIGYDPVKGAFTYNDHVINLEQLETLNAVKPEKVDNSAVKKPDKDIKKFYKSLKLDAKKEADTKILGTIAKMMIGDAIVLSKINENKDSLGLIEVEDYVVKSDEIETIDEIEEVILNPDEHDLDRENVDETTIETDHNLRFNLGDNINLSSNDVKNLTPRAQDKIQEELLDQYNQFINSPIEITEMLERDYERTARKTSESNIEQSSEDDLSPEEQAELMRQVISPTETKKSKTGTRSATNRSRAKREAHPDQVGFFDQTEETTVADDANAITSKPKKSAVSTDMSLVDAFKNLKSSKADIEFFKQNQGYVKQIIDLIGEGDYDAKLKKAKRDGKKSIKVKIDNKDVILTHSSAKTLRENLNNILLSRYETSKQNSTNSAEENVQAESQLPSVESSSVLPSAEAQKIQDLIADMNELEDIHKLFAGPDEELIGTEEDRASALRKSFEENRAVFDNALANSSISDELRDDINRAIYYYEHYGEYPREPYQNGTSSNSQPLTSETSNNGPSDGGPSGGASTSGKADEKETDSSSSNEKQETQETSSGVNEEQINEVVEEATEEKVDKKAKAKARKTAKNAAKIVAEKKEEIKKEAEEKARKEKAAEKAKLKEEADKKKAAEKELEDKKKAEKKAEQDALKAKAKEERDAKFQKYKEKTFQAFKKFGAGFKAAGTFAKDTLKKVPGLATTGAVMTGKGLKIAATTVKNVVVKAPGVIKNLATKITNHKNNNIDDAFKEMLVDSFDAQDFLDSYSEKTLAGVGSKINNNIERYEVFQGKIAAAKKQNKNFIPKKYFPITLTDDGTKIENEDQLNNFINSAKQLEEYKNTLAEEAKKKADENKKKSDEKAEAENKKADEKAKKTDKKKSDEKANEKAENKQDKAETAYTHEDYEQVINDLKNAIFDPEGFTGKYDAQLLKSVTKKIKSAKLNGSNVEINIDSDNKIELDQYDLKNCQTALEELKGYGQYLQASEKRNKKSNKDQEIDLNTRLINELSSNSFDPEKILSVTGIELDNVLNFIFNKVNSTIKKASSAVAIKIGDINVEQLRIKDAREKGYDYGYQNPKRLWPVVEDGITFYPDKLTKCEENYKILKPLAEEKSKARARELVKEREERLSQSAGQEVNNSIGPDRAFQMISSLANIFSSDLGFSKNKVLDNKAVFDFVSKYSTEEILQLKDYIDSLNIDPNGGSITLTDNNGDEKKFASRTLLKCKERLETFAKNMKKEAEKIETTTAEQDEEKKRKNAERERRRNRRKEDNKNQNAERQEQINREREQADNEAINSISDEKVKGAIEIIKELASDSDPLITAYEQKFAEYADELVNIAQVVGDKSKRKIKGNNNVQLKLDGKELIISREEFNKLGAGSIRFLELVQKQRQYEENKQKVEELEKDTKRIQEQNEKYEDVFTQSSTNNAGLNPFENLEASQAHLKEVYDILINPKKFKGKWFIENYGDQLTSISAAVGFAQPINAEKSVIMIDGTPIEIDNERLKELTERINKITDYAVGIDKGNSF